MGIMDAYPASCMFAAVQVDDPSALYNKYAKLLISMQSLSSGILDSECHPISLT